VTGPGGARGLRGPQGEPGFSALSQLPSAKTESGDFALSAPAANVGETLSTAVTFPVPLAAAIAAEKVEFATVTTGKEHCAGPGTAAKGYLCLYTNSTTNVEKPSAFDPEAAATEGTGRFGVGLSWKATATGPAAVSGTFSVTAG
jgi:hypothetical protein